MSEIFGDDGVFEEFGLADEELFAVVDPLDYVGVLFLLDGGWGTWRI